MADLVLRGQGLKNYMSVICAMEQNLYRQKAAVAQVENRIAALSNPYVAPAPRAPKKADRKFGGGICMLIGGISALFSAISFLGGGGIFAGIFYGLIALWLLSTGSDIDTQNKKIDENNSREQAYYRNALNAHDKNVKNAAAQKQMAQILRRRLSEMQAKVRDMERDLERAYSCNVIYPSYRNLVAVTSFYDYLQSNRCSSLEGHEGAYNLYNMESRLDKIITRLDRIGSQLESIKGNQYMLYTTLKESNRQLDVLNGAAWAMNDRLSALSANAAVTNAQLEKLSYNAELIKFNTDQTRQEVTLRNRMDGILNFNTYR